MGFRTEKPREISGPHVQKNCTAKPSVKPCCGGSFSGVSNLQRSGTYYFIRTLLHSSMQETSRSLETALGLWRLQNGLQTRQEGRSQKSQPDLQRAAGRLSPCSAHERSHNSSTGHLENLVSMLVFARLDNGGWKVEEKAGSIGYGLNKTKLFVNTQSHASSHVP